MTATEADRRRSRRSLRIGAGVAGLLLVAVAALVLLTMRDPAAVAVPEGGGPAVSDSGRPSPDVSWVQTLGVELPMSRTHGPRAVTSTTASGFSDSELGAAIAALHVLIRTSAAAGPRVFEPTITQQVTGSNAAAMKLLAAQQYEQLRAETNVAEGEPVSGDAKVLGYIVDAFASGTARVQVFLSSPTLDARGQLLRFTVQLERRQDDWAVVAPPRGDWGASSAVLSEAPTGLTRFDEVR